MVNMHCVETMRHIEIDRDTEPLTVTMYMYGRAKERKSNQERCATCPVKECSKMSDENVARASFRLTRLDTPSDVPGSLLPSRKASRHQSPDQVIENFAKLASCVVVS